MRIESPVKKEGREESGEKVKVGENREKWNISLDKYFENDHEDKTIYYIQHIPC